MKHPSHKPHVGLPRYDGLGAAVSALTISSATLQLAQEADAAMSVDGWALEAWATGPASLARADAAPAATGADTGL